jgi:hypothetical protein
MEERRARSSQSYYLSTGGPRNDPHESGESSTDGSGVCSPALAYKLENVGECTAEFF